MTISVTRDRTGKMTHVVHVRAHEFTVDELPAVGGDDVAVTVERDDADERGGNYRLRTKLRLTGALTDAQREELLAVAGKCPIHRLMTRVTAAGLKPAIAATTSLGFAPRG